MPEILEDNKHILKCQDTIYRYPEILQAATIILQLEVDKVWNINERSKPDIRNQLQVQFGMLLERLTTQYWIRRYRKA
jgi:hypothetical protein